MDMALIQGAISGLKAASDMTKGFVELKSLADVQTKVIALQGLILSAQDSALSAKEEQFAALDEIRALKAEIAQLKNWETEKQRYKLHSPWSGATVYALKKSMSNGESPHWVCATCFQGGKKVFLSQARMAGGKTFCECSSCKAHFLSPFRGEISMHYTDE